MRLLRFPPTAYISGDVAPGGRFKFSYISTTENSGVVVEETTEADTTVEETTAEDTEAPTDAPAETEVPTETEPAKSGCRSTLCGLSALLMILAFMPVFGKGKRD